MKLIHVAAAVLNQSPLDWQHNSANVGQAIQVARDQGAVVVGLPELCLTGYGCEDAFHAANTHQRAWAALQELLPKTRGMVVSFGLPVLHQNGLFNCEALAVDGRLAGLVAKRFLAGDGSQFGRLFRCQHDVGWRKRQIAPVSRVEQLDMPRVAVPRDPRIRVNAGAAVLTVGIAHGCPYFGLERPSPRHFNFSVRMS